ncbi:SPASM domain-containing protein [Sphingomonas sp. MMS24-J45]|uniref:SPASM domain-containing protein n=1 Tax=Sphingomonas sp. MMS24-J45 TaxID=3238806 RepID=UPI00384ADF5F
MDFGHQNEMGAADDADGVATPAAPPAPDYLQILENVVAHLEDGLDHPEIWQLLSAESPGEIADLRGLTERLIGQQSGTVLKALTVLLGILRALDGDRATGLALLDGIATQTAHCPQIAGAQFFVQRHGQDGPSPDLSDRFCDSPFVKFETLMDGTVAPCCSIWTEQRLGSLDGQSFAQIWNSEAAQAMRASILDGSYRHCNKQRCSFIIDDVLPKRDAVTDPDLRHIIDENVTELTKGPRWLFLAHDVTCNLACPSCRGGIEVADEEQERRFEIIERDVFKPLLNAEGEVLISVSGQGDPWSSPHYRSILRYMADHDLDARLNLHTNALLLNETRWAQYRGLEKYPTKVDVSIDSCTPWVYAEIRRPGTWAKLLPNLQFIAAKRARDEFREFHINATIQLDNFHEMPALVDLAETLGADSVRLYMMQNTGGHLAQDYERKNVGATSHPLHLAFLETLRDERLGRAIAHLYDVANWRTRSFEQKLPSDSLPGGFTLLDLHEAIREAHGMPERVIALCAAGRTRFRDDLDLPLIEANALAELGFSAQGQYRLNERTALGGEAIILRRQ